jgi:hypothetical protein
MEYRVDLKNTQLGNHYCIKKKGVRGESSGSSSVTKSDSLLQGAQMRVFGGGVTGFAALFSESDT